MPNRIVINDKKADLMKATVYGSDITQPIDIVDGAVSITGTVFIDSNPPLSINVIESVNLSIENNVSISIPDVTNVYTVKNPADTFYEFFFFPSSDTMTQVSSDLISVGVYDETTTYLYETTSEIISLTAELYVTSTSDKLDGVRYGNPQSIVEQLYYRGTVFSCTQTVNNLFAVIEGTAAGPVTIDLYVLGLKKW